MQQFQLILPAKQQISGRALAGVVGSGDMEVVLVAQPGQQLHITIITAIDNSQARWQALFERLMLFKPLPAGNMQIHDFGATPGVARIRLEQVLEELVNNDAN